ncbi:MAG: UDP-glucose--hexose-1-phosphate uridylyltransferase [Candidatus Adiutrix sp.]|nr:UDP-glucose--hexose-1-phosphate uridylyltransferase [Candidatus Adiutrix sp.]
MTINRELNRLLAFARAAGLIEASETAYAANQLIGLLKLPDFTPEEVSGVPASATPALEKILDWAAAHNLLENTQAQRDLFDTQIMGCLMPRPAEVIRRWQALYAESPERATDYYYNLSIASDYIRKSRTDRNLSWKTATDYGDLDITINVSKPEKDPRDIAAAKLQPSSGYPRCLLCRENEGFFGTLSHPARQTLRLIPLSLGGERWFLQYSPYIYYNEHCIILKHEHAPMRITRRTFERLLKILEILPHYFVGSNADLPIVGGSILSHDHYQGGRYSFAMDRAPVEKWYTPLTNGVEMGRIKWPVSALRLTGTNPAALAETAERLLTRWRGYSDPAIGLLAETGGEAHNTVTPIARRNGSRYELDLALRNNRTSPEFPLGLFHPHPDVQHIKKENIGLIEVLGLAILPDRLIPELALLRQALAEGRETVDERPDLAKHAAWYQELRPRLGGLPAGELEEALRREVGLKFLRVLQDAGVFKRDAAGLAAFDRFAECLS